MSDEAQLGTCGLCGQKMILTADDCWHPHDVERACPEEPKDMAGWQKFYDKGLRPGRPGRKHFRADESENQRLLQEAADLANEIGAV